VGVPVAEVIRKSENQRADVLPMEDEVCWLASGTGSSDGATAGGQLRLNELVVELTRDKTMLQDVLLNKSGAALTAWTDGGAAGESYVVSEL
jgi:hypothetical protein